IPQAIPKESRAMAIEVKVPVLPESVSDATIATWHKKPGDAVKRDENLVDLETDKVVLEVPSPVDGVLKQIVKDSGSTVTSQELIALLEEGAAQGSASAAGAAPGLTSSAAAKPAAASAVTPAAFKATAPAKPVAGSEQLSPAGLRVASEEKIDPTKVSGSGRDGRVTKEDLVNFMRSGAVQSDAANVAP
ncbi:dihydrolipoamide acetyltransferase, partial [mine drainage metagenome]